MVVGIVVPVVLTLVLVAWFAWWFTGGSNGKAGPYPCEGPAIVSHQAAETLRRYSGPFAPDLMSYVCPHSHWHLGFRDEVMPSGINRWLR